MLSIISILGLSLSLGFCILLFSHIRYEQSFDKFHEKKDHLYRLEMTALWNNDKENDKSVLKIFGQNGGDNNQINFPFIAGIDLQRTFSEIKSVTRIRDIVFQRGPQLIKTGTRIFKEPKVLYVDSNFLANFSFHVKAGNVQSLLDSKESVVISEDIAAKYFGGENPLGKIIEFPNDGNKLFKVTGVIENAPENSSIQYGLLLPLAASPQYDTYLQGGFDNMNCIVILELKASANVSRFEAKMNAWVKNYFTIPFFAANGSTYKSFNPNQMKWSLRPFIDCHYNISAPWGHYTDTKNIYQLSSLIIIILCLAALNYVLLTISNSASRSQEVAVRRVLGSKKASITFQFWLETQLTVIISAILGLLLAFVFLSPFRDIIGSGVSLRSLSVVEVLTAMLVFCALLALIAGYYPAKLLSKGQPSQRMKSFQTLKLNPRLAAIIVVTQYAVCTILIVAAVTIYLQMSYISHKPLGYDREQVLIVESPTTNYDLIKKLYSNFTSTSQSDPEIVNFTACVGGLTGEFSNVNGFILDGIQQWVIETGVDYNYFNTLGIKIQMGRSFSKDIASDSLRPIPGSGSVVSCVVNETLYKQLGNNAKVGEFCKPINAIIIGVSSDYHFENLMSKIKPQMHILMTRYFEHFIFKIAPGKVQTAITKIENVWKKNSPGYPFEYKFLDQSINKMYESQDRWEKTVNASCFFAVLIAAMGLFGLSSINALNRTKEIGIRKLLGANTSEIVLALVINLAIKISIAILIAIPVAWWIMNRWLLDFAYRIELSWWTFAASAFVALIIGLATISFHSFKAARANPIKCLASI
ncbi:MAG TPA: ABC transporter permease [Puia sp.]|nr:ABC transporter permease [Puia sp.]